MMKMKKAFLILLAISTLLILGGPASAVNMEAGKWEITSRVEMPGMPMQMPPMTSVQCLTQDEPAPSNPTAADNSDCSIADMKTDGNTVSWKMKCNAEGQKVMIEGKITYAGTTFEGVMTTLMDQDGETMEIKTIMNGKRLGNCE